MIPCSWNTAVLGTVGATPRLDLVVAGWGWGIPGHSNARETGIIILIMNIYRSSSIG